MTHQAMQLDPSKVRYSEGVLIIVWPDALRRYRVTAEEYRELLAADSMGSHFNRRLRKRELPPEIAADPPPHWRDKDRPRWPTPTALCPECDGSGYVLIQHHAGEGDRAPGAPVVLCLTACYHPECTLDRPRPIASLQVLGMFTQVVRHPATDAVVALDGFTEPVFR